MILTWNIIPSEIKEIIFDFTDEKQRLKNYFMNYIACYIDISLLLIPNGCEFCYIDILKKRRFCLCYSCFHKIPIKYSTKKWFSITTLFYGKHHRITKLFYALNNINKLLDLLYESNWSSIHPLAWLNYHILHHMRRIN